MQQHIRATLEDALRTARREFGQTYCGLIGTPTLDPRWPEFCRFAQGDGLVAPPDFVSAIGTLFPTAPCGLSSL